MATNKGFIKDYNGNILLPVTRGELLLDSKGQIALFSDEFLATSEHAGLMTAAEKAMLNGSSGQGLSDVYTKLGYINNGLQVNGNSIKFYDNTHTPINIVTSETIEVYKPDNENKISFKLTKVTNDTEIKNIIKEIKVDQYGRVINVNGSALTNDDIPQKLTGKSIENGIFTGCTTASDTISTDADNKTIVNKKYVDDEVSKIAGVVSNTLKFGGSINSETIALQYLESISTINDYYKVVEEFSINKEHLFNQDSYNSDRVLIKVGDTLIVHRPAGETKSVFVHVPSGDEDITRITIKTISENLNETSVLNNVIGNVTFKFSDIFDVQGTGQIATISVKQASQNSGGYLSKEDWIKFNSYASQEATTYTPTITNDSLGKYTIGILTIGGVDNIIYGKDTISTLTLNEGTGTDKSYNPVLKFEKTGTTPLEITLKGNKGVEVIKSDNNIEFNVKNEVNLDSTNYINIIDGYKFSIKKGSVSENGTVVNGITDYNEFNTFRSASVQYHQLSVYFETISNSLEADSGYDYYYGSEKLINAITI